MPKAILLPELQGRREARTDPQPPHRPHPPQPLRTRKAIGAAKGAAAGSAAGGRQRRGSRGGPGDDSDEGSTNMESDESQSDESDESQSESEDSAVEGGPSETMLGGKAFERIRMVGRGAFGTAVLYRRAADGALVVVKEVNLSELKPQDRLLAQNEVRVLDILDHPNVIGYFDSHREGNLLRIEMEYADGGNLHQWLQAQKGPVAEAQVLRLFKQILRGMEYVHANNILHRDLKSANIFLNVKGVPMIGDFGISRVLNTMKKAVTVVGTPYYVSPELCRGLPYDSKSDVWSLGCILYEMCTRKLPFSGDNLPALVKKITEGQYAPLPDTYSEGLRRLVADIFTHNQEDRPSCAELLRRPIFRNVQVPRHRHRAPDSALAAANAMLGRSSNTLGGSGLGGLGGATGMAGTRQSRRSTELELANGDLFQPALGGNEPSFPNAESSVFFWHADNAWPEQVRFGRGLRIVQVSCGAEHCLALNSERQVFSWGGNAHGQLGVGHTKRVSRPLPLEDSGFRAIVHIAAGGNLSAFVSENGLVSTCGDGRSGALGHGNTKSLSTPRLVEDLLAAEVVHLAIGTAHMVAVTSEAAVYTWGNGDRGQLGLPGGVRLTSAPLRAPLPSDSIRPVRAFAGPNASLVLSEAGRLFACGDNSHNKLALNPRFGILGRRTVESADRFTLVKLVGKGRVLDAAVGADITCTVMDSGKCYTLGCNAQGGLGTGNTKQREQPASVKPTLSAYASQLCAVGDGFVMVAAMPKDDPWLRLHLAEGDRQTTTTSSSKGAALGRQRDSSATPVLPRQDLFAWGAGFMGMKMEEAATGEAAEALALPNKICISIFDADDDDEAESGPDEDGGPAGELDARDGERRAGAAKGADAHEEARPGAEAPASRQDGQGHLLPPTAAKNGSAQGSGGGRKKHGGASPRRRKSRGHSAGKAARGEASSARSHQLAMRGTAGAADGSRIVGSASLASGSLPQLISSVDADGTMIILAIDLQCRPSKAAGSSARVSEAASHSAASRGSASPGHTDSKTAHRDGSPPVVKMPRASGLQDSVDTAAEDSDVPVWVQRELDDGPVLKKPPSLRVHEEPRPASTGDDAAAPGGGPGAADASDPSGKGAAPAPASPGLEAYVDSDSRRNSASRGGRIEAPVVRDNSFNEEVVDNGSDGYDSGPADMATLESSGKPLFFRKPSGEGDGALVETLHRRGATLTRTRPSRHPEEDSPSPTGTITLKTGRTSAMVVSHPASRCVAPGSRLPAPGVMGPALFPFALLGPASHHVSFCLCLGNARSRPWWASFLLSAVSRR